LELSQQSTESFCLGTVNEVRAQTFQSRLAFLMDEHCCARHALFLEASNSAILPFQRSSVHA
jgi:hypothetical protein